MKKIKLSVILIVTIIMMVIFTGCANKDEDELVLSVVVGTHSNAMEIPLNSTSINEAIYNCCYTYGSISFVSVDGDPQVYYQTDIPQSEISGLTQSKQETIANEYTEQLLIQINNAIPSVSEVDTLKAIQLAAYTLEGEAESADKTMIIMDTGLATTGYIDFTEGLLDADVDSIIEALEGAEAIPNLEGIQVIWMFLGQTSYPQEELSEAQKSKLEEIWTAVLTTGGASDIYFTTDIVSDTSSSEYPSVSVVSADERSMDVEIEVVDIIEQPLETVILDNTSVEFIGDTANFISEELAMQELETLAQQLISNPNNVVYVIGTTATGNNVDFCDQLSLERAEAVVNALITLGVNKEQLIAVGLGFEDPWHIDDLDANGNQVETFASQNRKVLIVDVNSDDAEKLE